MKVYLKRWVKKEKAPLPAAALRYSMVDLMILSIVVCTLTTFCIRNKRVEMKWVRALLRVEVLVSSYLSQAVNGGVGGHLVLREDFGWRLGWHCSGLMVSWATKNWATERALHCLYVRHRCSLNVTAVCFSLLSLPFCMSKTIKNQSGVRTKWVSVVYKWEWEQMCC